MKKFILFFILLFAFTLNIKASESQPSFQLGYRVPNTFIKAVDGDKSNVDYSHTIQKPTGETIYCIDPFKLVSTSYVYKEYDYNDEIFNLTDEQLNRINLLGYFGYKYKNHTDLKWYAITQLLIWRELDIEDAYFLDSNDGDRIEIYEEEIEELKNLVDTYYEKPSFSDENFNLTINNSYEFIDTNEVLNNYEVISSDIDSKIEGNKLYITTANIGTYSIKFIKKSPVEYTYLLYNLSGYQNVIYPGKINDIEFNISVEVNSGSIKINKADSENVERDFASLEGAIYGIYKDNNLINEIITDENGVAYIGDLPFGEYTIKELVASKGYSIDDEIYKVELTTDNKEVTIISKENIIKGYVILNKYYGNEDYYEIEDGAVFEIYDANNSLIGTYETKKGKIEEELAFGNYQVVQTKGKTGYSFVDNFNISIDENKKYSFNLYDNVLIVSVPNTGITSKRLNIGSILLILSGICLILKSIKKTTHLE